MAQLGDLVRAKDLLQRAARAFGPKEAVARARCVVGEAEIALVSRDLGWPAKALDAARATLEARGDRVNAAFARNLEARRLLLIGRLDEAERTLAEPDSTLLPPASRVARELVSAGTAIRRLQTKTARAALTRAEHAAREVGTREGAKACRGVRKNEFEVERPLVTLAAEKALQEFYLLGLVHIAETHPKATSPRFSLARLFASANRMAVKRTSREFTGSAALSLESGASLKRKAHCGGFPARILLQGRCCATRNRR